MAGKFYRITGIFYLCALVWLIFTLSYEGSGNFTFCLFKNVSGFSCPACGTGRSLTTLLRGEPILLSVFNPLAFVWLVAFGVFPIVWVYDFITEKSFLWLWYQRFLVLVKRPVLYIPLILLVLCNWFWNLVRMI